MVELEKRGIPTVSITSHGFEADFVESIKVFGIPGLPQVIIPHTLTSRTPEQASGDADAAFQDIVRALTTPPPERPMSAKQKLQQADRERFSGADRDEALRNYNREYISRGIGDGFPLVAPTPQLVEAFLKATKRSPLDVVGKWITLRAGSYLIASSEQGFSKAIRYKDAHDNKSLDQMFARNEAGRTQEFGGGQKVYVLVWHDTEHVVEIKFKDTGVIAWAEDKAVL